jgi:hypothetical protein
MSDPVTDAGTEELAAFRRYLEILTEGAQLGGLQRTRTADVEAARRAAVDAAALTDRKAADTARAIERTLDAMRPRIRRVAARADSDAPTPRLPAPPVDSLESCAALAHAIEADLRAVESSWAWIERQHGARERSAATPATPVPSAVSSSNLEQEPSSSVAPKAMRLIAVALVILVVVGALILMAG